MVAVAPDPDVSLQFTPIGGTDTEQVFVDGKDGEGTSEGSSSMGEPTSDPAESNNIFEKSDDSSCTLVCESNHTEFDTVQQSEEVIQLKFLTHQFGWWTLPIAEAYNELMQGRVKVEVVQVSVPELVPNIINEAQSKIGLYDGFFTGPGVLGSIVEEEGFADLTPYIQESAERTQDWNDVLLGYRQEIAQYEDKILMYPLDGDTLSLYYRKDILEHFNLSVPRTWEEYTAVAKATHGKTFKNTTLTGSCVARKTSCSNAYWANMVLSTMTQTNGPSSGHMFDTSDLKPLTGAALEETLLVLEEQAKYGADEEFGEGCIGPVNFDLMFKGECVLTYNWGNNFKRYLEEGTALEGNYGVAPTPGSQQVLDRDTMKLVDCTAERCKHADFYDDLGYVNRAPYLAFGGWACAVNNYTTERKKRLAMDFLAFAASKEFSIQAVIPEAKGNTTIEGRPATQNGQDPFRTSHLDLDLYEAMGYERETAAEFIDSIQKSLESPNLVKDIRFPTNSEIYKVLDVETHAYLSAATSGEIPLREREAKRREVSDSITQQWVDIIDAHNAKSSTKTQVLESYQRLRNVYSPEVDENYLGGIRGYGTALVSLVIFLSVVFGVWTYKYRGTKVVRASQPFFLLMIICGCIVLGSAIFPMGIDDETSSVEACSRACMSVPWLIALGWSIIFSALFSKLWRVNIVYRNSMHFRRLKVSEKDVLLPFAILFTSNLLLLILWTVLDPLTWERVMVSETESYGTCSADNDSNTWKIFASLLAVLNGIALILANVEAFKARHIATEYGESKHIGMIMGSILQVVLVGLPLLFLVDDNPTASYFIRCSIVFVICMSVLLLIFVPKVQVWWTKKEGGKERHDSRRTSSGLRYQIYESPAVVADRAGKLMEIRESVKNLEHILVERGIDTQSLFHEAGLDTESLMENSHHDMAANAPRVAGLFPTASNSSGPHPSSVASDAAEHSVDLKLEDIPESAEEAERSFHSLKAPYNGPRS